jgi:hypothetical protein
MKLLLLFATVACLQAADPGNFLRERLPPWLKLSGEFRSRMEGRTGFNFEPGNDDAYTLFRVRVNVNITPVSWLEVGFQGTDSRVAGIAPVRPLGIFKNPADIRQAYVRFGNTKGPIRLTIGRQLLNYGAQRILGPLDWTNNSRNWDAIKLELGNADTKLDIFASSVVETSPLRRLDQPRRGYNIHGAYGALRKLIPFSTLEPYLLYKTGGGSGVTTAGLRLASLPAKSALKGWDYQVEASQQYGRFAGLAHQAWAFSGLAGKTLTPLRWSPRLSAEYSAASGDRNPGDRVHRTFDHLLGTNHLFYGLVDAVGWQNMRNVRLGLDAKPRKSLQFVADYHWLWLGSASDSLYDVAGRATVRPRAGNTARSIGTELDFTVNWTASSQWKIGGGVGHLFAGSFLKQNSAGSNQTFPYVFTQYSF